jgi:hypothetical protein
LAAGNREVYGRVEGDKGRRATGKLVAGLEAPEAADNREVSSRVGGDKGRRWVTGKLVAGLAATRGGGQQESC